MCISFGNRKIKTKIVRDTDMLQSYHTSICSIRTLKIDNNNGRLDKLLST